MIENIPQINVRNQTIDSASSEKTRQDKCPQHPPKKNTPRHIIFKLEKIKDQGGNSERSPRRKIICRTSLLNYAP